MKPNRLKELEKIADKLGIGQNREVECVSCHKTIHFKDAILLTNKETVSHLCRECNEKLINGELTKKQIEGDTILKQIEKLREQEERNRKIAPYIPTNPNIPDMIPDMRPIKRIDYEPYIMPYGTGDITYHVYSSKADLTSGSTLLKFEPQRGIGE
jgi:hypothetical protein